MTVSDHMFIPLKISLASNGAPTHEEWTMRKATKSSCENTVKDIMQLANKHR